MSSTSFDIAVVGGGVAGVAAACAAAHQGMQVVLIDRNAVLGGLATNAEVGTICGLYSNDSSERFTYNVGRFAEEFAREIQVRSASTPEMDTTGLKYLPYSPEDAMQLCEEILAEAGVHVLKQTELIDVQTVSEEISSIIVNRKGVENTLGIKALVDATGVSRVSKILNLEIIPTEFKQSASQVFTLNGINFSSEKNLSLVLLKALRIGVMNNDLEEYEDRVYLVPGSLKAGSVSLKLTVPAPMNIVHTKPELKKTAEHSIKNITDYLKQSVEGLSDVNLMSIAPAVGVRVGDRPVGKRMLSEQDVLMCKKSDQMIARGNWPAEIWSEKRRVELHHLKENDHYDVPAGCLISNKIVNLFFAGRCISATDMGIASARVIGVCLQTGYASGLLASGSVRGENEEDIIERIKQEQFN